MSGNKPGVQQRLASVYSKATFVNSDNHTLNLVDIRALSHKEAGVTFFRSVQFNYVYFSRSTLRWKKLKITLGKLVKPELVACWSTRVEAV